MYLELVKRGERRKSWVKKYLKSKGVAGPKESQERKDYARCKVLGTRVQTGGKKKKGKKGK